MKNTVMEVNVSSFLHNIEQIKYYAKDKEIMPVIKANAYGTYLNHHLDLLNRFSIVAVAEVQEGVQLRKLGYQKEIFILNQPLIEEIKDIYENNLIIGLSEKSFLEKIDVPIRVHLEIETGMNRTGIQKKDWKTFFDEVKKNENIMVDGIYTHFSSADTDIEYTKRQVQIFQEAITFGKKYFSFRYIHCSASNGILNFSENFSNLVRPGILMYGYESYSGVKEKISLKPVARLKTRITYLKELDKDEAISYNQKFISKEPMKVATIPIGYADGLRRNLLHKAKVVVKGEKRNILGTICMDSCMIDVTGLEVEVGDWVYIWDNDLISLEEIAATAGTIPYEIISTISDRVKREFIEEA